MKIALAIVVLCGALSPAFSLSYLESLGSPSTSIGGGKGSGGMGSGPSYLDALKSETTSAPQGAGLKGYLDGMTSSTTVSTPPPPPPIVQSFEDGPSMPTSGNYLAALSGSSTSGAPSGSGITGYLDALPRSPAISGGRGILSHTDSLPATNVASGGGGISTYMDSLGGTVGSIKSSSQVPSSSSSSPSSKSVGSFTLETEGLGQLLKNLKDATIGRINLSGTFDSISFD